MVCRVDERRVTARGAGREGAIGVSGVSLRAVCGLVSVRPGTEQRGELVAAVDRPDGGRDGGATGAERGRPEVGKGRQREAGRGTARGGGEGGGVRIWTVGGE